jgi:hypothetical protein
VPTDSPSPSPILSPSACLTIAPTQAPVVTPVPALFSPTFSCTTSGTTATCTTKATYYSKDTASWSGDDANGTFKTPGSRSKSGRLILTHNFGNTSPHYISVTVSRNGTSSKSASGQVW